MESKMTRMTRMLYVEEMEVSDTETENASKTFKSFEMETKVENKVAEPSPTTASNQQESEIPPPKSPKPRPTSAWDKITKSKMADKGTPGGSGEVKMPKMFSSGVVRPKPPGQGETGSGRGVSLRLGGLGTSGRNLGEMATIEESVLYDKLSILFFCMKISGLFFIKRKKTADRRAAIKNCTPLQAYCCFICWVLVLNFARSLSALDSFGFDSVLLFKFLSCIFYYESMTRCVLAYWHCSRKKKGLQEFFLGLEAMCYPDGIIPYESSLIRTMYVFVAMAFLISIANVSATAYGLFGPENIQELFNIYLVPLDANMPGVEGVKVFVLVLTFVNTQVAIFSLSFYTVVCYILYKEFEYLCRTFMLKIREDGQFSDDLEKFRIRHQKRCKLVERADDMFKYYIANTYLTNIPLLCLLLYSMVATENDVAYRFISFFRLTYVLVQMLVLSVAATMINDQAHAPLADIYSIRVQSTTSERQLEVNMFLNKLTGTSIGLTAWDMFVINKPTLLTVLGMILTYFFLLVQFKNPLQLSPVCNCMFRTDNGSDVNITSW